VELVANRPDSFHIISFGRVNELRCKRYNLSATSVRLESKLIAAFYPDISLLYLEVQQRGRFSPYLFANSIYPVLLMTFDDHFCVAAMYLISIAFGFLYVPIGSVPFSLFTANRQEKPLLTNRP
jgi:hypothetical protein